MTVTLDIYPSIDEWIEKICCICPMEYYSIIKNNEMIPFAASWMDLEITILSEVCLTEKNKYPMILLVCSIYFTYETETDS